MNLGYGAGRLWWRSGGESTRNLHHMTILEMVEWLEHGYIQAGSPFGDCEGARTVWLRYRCHTTLN